MKKIVILFVLSAISLMATANESKVCQKCHPTIYKEYYSSSHRKASIYSNPIHKAFWDKYPKTKKGYTCAKCHSPSDKKALKSGIVEENSIQKNEPISCVYCHTIKEIKDGEVSDSSVSSGKKKEFYTAELPKKGSKNAEYKIKSSWFGLVKTATNSPYHKIDYNNENYYNGNMCMGCHSHTNNEHGLNLTMLDAYIDKKDKNSCISCHMPQIAGTKVTLVETKTHAFHGIAGIHNMNAEMGKYMDFSLQKSTTGFVIEIINKANHALFGQAYRQGELRVVIDRKGKEIAMKPFIFTRILAKDSKEIISEEADTVLKDTLIYAKKRVTFNQPLQKGDMLRVTIGLRLLTPKASKELGLQENKEVNRFRVLKRENFKIKN
jgi:hypothetical protein